MREQAARSASLSVEEIRWDLAPAPWVSSSRLLALVCDVLPTIRDDLVADLVERLALLVTERDEQLLATREVLSATFGSLHVRGEDVVRLRARVIELREALRTAA